MKMFLSLALAFTVSSLGLISLSAQSVRAQQVASAGKSISEIKEEYERLLAVDRDPSTPTEVRELNQQFLEKRRTQLRTAIEGRLGALRKYQGSMGASLSGEESLVVGNSIQALEKDLSALAGDRKTTAAPLSPPRARLVGVNVASGLASEQSRNVQSGQTVQVSNASEASAGAESGTGADTRAPGRVSAISITSPDSDKTVHVGEIEIEVSVGDEDVDDIMVAIYTQSSGQKPATARTLELKRSNRGKKSFPIALEAGANRIEVSDLKRGGVLATRTLTYTPTRDMLNSTAQAANDSAPETENLVIKKLEAVTANQATICGQLQLASLNRTFALIRSTPELGDLAARFRAPKLDPRRQYQGQRELASDYLGMSQISDNCESQTNLVKRDGLQRSAAIDLLRAVLLRLNSDLKPKDTDINDIALRKERSYLLETTTTDSDVQEEAAKTRGSNVPREEKRTDGKIRTQDLRLAPSSAFSSLSADTIRKQIVLLEQYLGNVEVRLMDGDTVVARTLSDRDGNFAFTPTPPADGTSKDYVISTEGDENYTTRKVRVAKGDKVRINLDIEDRPVSLLARTIVGYDQAGAAAAKREQSFFLDFFVSKSFPFRQKINPDFGERWRLWGDFRINSVPQPGNTALGTFVSDFSQQAANVQVKDVARVFEFLGGVEVRLTGNNALLPSFDRQTKQKFSLSFIAAYGGVTPLDPLESAPAVFRVFDDAPGLPPEARGKEFVAFIPSDRDRFFRQYYAGLRVQTFFFNKYNVPMQRFPAQFDVIIGQNEFVTGGRLHGPVVRMEGFFPLPYEKAKFINLFATATMIPGRSNINTPLILQPAPAGTIVPASNVVLIGVPQPNRDYYRIGIGIDAIPFFQKLLQVPGGGGNK
ncbi:MAG: hypothetical protein H7Z38_12245 [Rubrivivax sp.]|nr:hypothetical protein [Pyrinomonadaceae bacterium]